MRWVEIGLKLTMVRYRYRTGTFLIIRVFCPFDGVPVVGATNVDVRDANVPKYGEVFFFF